VKEKPAVGSPFLWSLISDRIHKVTKDVNVHFFIHGFTRKETANFPSCIFYQRILGTFCSYFVLLVFPFI